MPVIQKPIDSATFAACMRPLGSVDNAGHVAVGVSGGPDSMALAMLSRDWARDKGVQLTALTVDHGLRPDSAEEARQVAEWCSARSIAHEILTWRGEKPRANVQAMARQARYHLLDERCIAQNVPVLLLAHHLEDQAETVLLRLGRGSGVYGLAGMSREATPAYPGAPVRARPLLGIAKDRLIATLKAAGQRWIEDPSNHDPRFSRVRARKLWRDLAQIGITPDRVAKTAENMARARQALDGAARALIAADGTLCDAGYCTIARTPLVGAYEEVGLRALALMLMAVGGQSFAPRFRRLEHLWSRIAENNLAGGATLGGCRIVPSKDGESLHIIREARSMEGPRNLVRGRQIWDGRFLIRSDSAGARRVDRLGRSGLAALRDSPVASKVKSMPIAARSVMPAVFDREGLAAVPALGYRRAGLHKAGISVEFLPRHALSAAKISA